MSGMYAPTSVRSIESRIEYELSEIMKEYIFENTDSVKGIVKRRIDDTLHDIIPVTIHHFVDGVKTSKDFTTKDFKWSGKKWDNQKFGLNFRSLRLMKMFIKKNQSIHTSISMVPYSTIDVIEMKIHAK